LRREVLRREIRQKEGGEFERCSSYKNLHAMVDGVGHDHAPVAVDGDAAAGLVE
jgi:hypothetical protein